jgi:kynurenine formamidase
VPALVDLTQEIFVGMPVFPGHLKTVLWEHASHDETARNFEGGFSFRSWGLLMSDHGPTHVDSISHFDPRDGAPTIDEMPLTAFYGPGTCVDVSHVPPRCDITAADLDVAVGRTGDLLARGDALLLHTGAAARCGGTPDYAHDYSGLSADAAEWLVERGVRLFGVDAPSPDNPASRTYPVHMMCRRTGITHYENLANLDRVIGTRFTFIGFPLRIRGGTGSPVRAVAVLDDPPPGEPVR